MVCSDLFDVWRSLICKETWYQVSYQLFTTRDIDTLEKVQRCATKHLRGLAHLTYESRLEILDLYSLYCRRQRGDMIETYKILKRHYDLDPSTFFTLNTATTRGHSLKLFKERSRLLVRQNFFTNRIVNLWNSLPDYHFSTNSCNLQAALG